MKTIRDVASFLKPTILIAAISTATPTQAYIGPGAGLGAVAVTVALSLGVIFLLFGLIWYPLKRLLKKYKSHASTKNTQN